MIDEDTRTLWCGNLPDQVTEELLYELFLQAGPLETVRIPRDKDGRQKNFAFITYCHDVSVPYAINLFRGTALFHKTLSLQSRARTGLIPPPIRSTTLDPSYDFLAQSNVKQQFEAMTGNLQPFDQRGIQCAQVNPDYNDRLVVASLQGNWNYRHHPYRNDRDGRRHHGRGHDHNNDRNDGHRQRPNNNWRDRDRREKSTNHGPRSHRRMNNH